MEDTHKLRYVQHIAMGALALVMLTGSSLVAEPTATLYLVNPGSGANLAGIYTSPYNGSINGGPTVPIICDDFADETYQSEYWQTFVTPLSTVTSESSVDNTLKWTGAGTLNQAQAYEAAAILAVDILQSPAASLNQELYSYALWALFDPTSTVANPGPGAIDWLNTHGDGGDVPTVNSYVNAAINDVTNPSATINGQTLSQFLNTYHVTIYSFDTSVAPTCPGGGCPPPPQEFLTVTTPEASTPIVMAVDLLAFLGLFAFLRRRSVRLFN